MINRKAFAAMRTRMEQFDAAREEIIKLSRDALKSSKAAIYALHRDETDDATAKLARSRKILHAVKGILAKDAHLASVGAAREAKEEYAEASLFAHFLKTGALLAPDALDMDTDVYLSALSDLCGELVRKAINSSIAGDHDTAIRIHAFVLELYSELMLFDFRNSSVRKKFDSIKYGLEKLEDLVLKLKLTP